MVQVRIDFISGGTLPIDVYISDIFGNNRYQLETITSAVPPEVVYNVTIPEIFQTAPEVLLTMVDSTGCIASKKLPCIYGCTFSIIVELAS